MGRQYCAMALGNLAAEPENHEDIVKVRNVTTPAPTDPPHT